MVKGRERCVWGARGGGGWDVSGAEVSRGGADVKN